MKGILYGEGFSLHQEIKNDNMEVFLVETSFRNDDSPLSPCFCSRE